MDKNKKINLINPWSGAIGRMMTWSEIRAWAAENLRREEYQIWLRIARRAWNQEDGKKLGIMIIGA